MKWFLFILVLVASSFIAQAQELPEDWDKQADTAYVEKDSVVGIAKGKSTDWNTSKSIALMNAKFEILRLLKLQEMTTGLDIIDDKCYTSTNDDGYKVYTYHVAIKIKKPYQLKIKQVKFED